MSITKKIKPGHYTAKALDGTVFHFRKNTPGFAFRKGITGWAWGTMIKTPELSQEMFVIDAHGFPNKKSCIADWLDKRANQESPQQIALRGLRNEFTNWVSQNDDTFQDLWVDYKDGLNGEPTISYLQFVAMVLVKGEKGETAKQTNNGNAHWQTTFASHEEVDKAVDLGVLNKRQGAAYKANITISNKLAA